MRLLVVGLMGVVVLGPAVRSSAGEKKPKVAAVDPNARVGVVTRVFKPAVQRNWRGAAQQELDAVVWYPAAESAVETKQYVGEPGNPLFLAGSAMPHAGFEPRLGRFPLVLLSHGSGGTAMQMAWVGTGLARAGFIAVAVDHPGNNADGKLTPEGMALWWERATDLSNTLDAMLKDEEFGPRIDPTRVAAAGYSLGGYTVLELAGAQTDISRFFDRCRMKPGVDVVPADGKNGKAQNSKAVAEAAAAKAADSAVCQTPEGKGLGTPDQVLAAVRRTSRESLARSGDSFRDARVKAVFALAPALGFTQTEESLRGVKIPVEMVVGTEDRTAPAEENTDYLRSNLHQGRETVLPGVTHYTFLDSCTAAGKQVLPQYCTDLPGIERDAVHAQVMGMMVEFFDRTLKLR